MNKNVFEEMAGFINDNTAFSFCVITDSQGSTPRKAGSKMIVFADGSSTGTVGGGAFEMQVQHDALEAIKTGKIVTKQYQLDCDLDMQCGGSMTVYIEPFAKRPELYIFGAGHIGRELGPLASKLGFRVTYIDERDGIFNSIKADGATCINTDVIKFAEQLLDNTKAYIVIATYEHALDEALVGILSKREFAYIGMIGSKRKVATIRKKLIENKGISENQVNNVDMPVGIPFRTETPFEIALSIAARLTDIKNSCHNEA